MIYDKELNAWKSEETIFGNLVDVMLIDIDLEAKLTKEEILKRIVLFVKSKKDKIEESIATSLLETYNNNWAEENSLKLSKEEFLSKITLYAINYEVEDVGEGVYSLYYSNSDMFCGHSIEVFMDVDDEISSTLVG